MTSTERRLLDHGYAVIISSPQMTIEGVPNEDALAATLINALLETIGSHQQALRVFDLRNEWIERSIREYLVARSILAPDQAIPTPIFYSASENTFAAPGLVSLELLMMFASYYITVPSKSLLRILAQFPPIERLSVPDTWNVYVSKAIENERQTMGTVEGQFFSRYAPDAETLSASDAVAAAEAMDYSNALKLLPKEDQSKRQAHVAYMTGMETYVDFSVAQRFGHAQPMIAGRIPERLRKQGERLKDGAILIREKDVMPRSSGMKSEIANVRERRTRYRRELESKWKQNVGSTA